jgi:mono/diheme cytochrome c family protein
MLVRAALIAIAAAITISGPALAQDRATMGHELARMWCASCHQIEASATARDFAPSFITLANDRTRGEDLNWVRVRMQTPLYPMAGINLSNQQIEDIVAYFGTLQDE